MRHYLVTGFNAFSDTKSVSHLNYVSDFIACFAEDGIVRDMAAIF